MTARSFVDTNVVVYAADENPADRAKHDAAVKLLADQAENLVLSTQVLQEFYHAVTRKLAKPLDAKRAAAAARALTKLDVVGSDADLVIAAIETSQSAQISIWDALIVAAASLAQCERILTEDLADGQIIRGVRIENPFRKISS
ncbi:MAG TPA: PIN domain-containing protein [Streptosporangiaceae bacterium]